jgi:hypothetical protein
MKYNVKLVVNFDAVYKGQPKKGRIIFVKPAEIWFPKKTALPPEYLKFLTLQLCRVSRYAYDDINTMTTFFEKNTPQALMLNDDMIFQILEEMTEYGWSLFYSDFDVINET